MLRKVLSQLLLLKLLLKNPTRIRTHSLNSFISGSQILNQTGNIYLLIISPSLTIEQLLSVGRENVNLKPIEMKVCLIKPTCS